MLRVAAALPGPHPLHVSHGNDSTPCRQGMPDGKFAKAGKTVFVKYTGRLKSSDKVFDATKGNKAFSFRLGVGEVRRGTGQWAGASCLASHQELGSGCIICSKSQPVPLSRGECGTLFHTAASIESRPCDSATSPSGRPQVIKGWDRGVEGMRIGDRRRLIIPPAMAYGTSGAGKAIPPNAWLDFEVELVNVK